MFELTIQLLRKSSVVLVCWVIADREVPFRFIFPFNTLQARWFLTHEARYLIGSHTDFASMISSLNSTPLPQKKMYLVKPGVEQNRLSAIFKLQLYFRL